MRLHFRADFRTISIQDCKLILFRQSYNLLPYSTRVALAQGREHTRTRTKERTRPYLVDWQVGAYFSKIYDCKMHFSLRNSNMRATLRSNNALSGQIVHETHYYYTLE
jgi:hypothetical protein